MFRQFALPRLWIYPCCLLLLVGDLLVAQDADGGADPSAADAEAATVSGRVTNVTLYRGQAQITRTVSVAGDAGNLEIVVADLPEHTVPESLFAEAGDQAEIRAVRYRTRAVGEAPREEVRRLDQQIQQAAQELELAVKRHALLKKRIDYLAKLEAFVAPTAHADLSKGVLDAEALERLTNFSFEQHELIAAQQVELARQSREIQERIELLERKRGEITTGASRTVREAVLFLNKRAVQPAEVRLNYLVGNCGWSPTYTMRAADDRKQVSVEYNGLIHQLTGENWKDVELTLSTASPSLGAASPGLAPFFVTLAPLSAPNQAPQQGAAGFYGRGLSEGQVLEQLQGMNQQRSQFERQLGNAVNFDDNMRLSWNLNDFACSYNLLEINGDAVTLGALSRDVSDQSDGPSLNYRLASPVSVASRRDQQMVRIMQTDMHSQFYHVAAPVLNSYVYREAELMNGSAEDLLAGPMTVYVEGRFVGRGEIPTVARGQTFVVGFGADPQLRTRRELVERRDEVQGGNRETQLDYRLIVENFRSQPTSVRMIDRLPHSDNGADMRITLGKTSDAISSDKLYQREERPMGILRWDIEAPAAAAGENARLVEYSYAVEYDRQYVVSLPTSRKAQQEEFERLQLRRLKH